MAARRKKEIYKLPILPLRGLAIFPSTITHFEVARDKSIKALEEAMQNDQVIFLTTQKNVEIELPTEEDFHKVGTICKIKQMLKIPGSNVRVLVEGLSRGKITELEESEPFFSGKIEGLYDRAIKSEKKVYALMDMIFEAFDELMKENGKNSQVIFDQLSDLDQPSVFADTVASYMELKPDQIQSLIEQLDIEKRLSVLYLNIKEELETAEIRKKVDKRVKNQVSKIQKDYYLREQIKAIQKELGEDEDIQEDVENFKDRLIELNLSETVTKKVGKEIEKLGRMNSSSSDYSVTRNYIETILDLPWNIRTEDNKDLNKSIEILEADHFGLEKVKERIVEFLAVRQLSEKMKSPIICLVGPPGVGKTSIAKSLANAMDRKFVRISLGGLRDEAEIRGHRRTYVGAIPGRIINSIKDIKVANPVFLFDEIDKMASDFKGDPASALLEVLDPEQNNDFVDHYLEVPFDLSKVMFITTANTLSTIPGPLLDRMEVIEISGYTELEKLEIAKKYLIKKQLDENGLTPEFITIEDDVLKYIINSYTRESGVRRLERQIGKICRKVAVQKVKNPQLENFVISKEHIKEYLGKEIIRRDKVSNESKIGEVTGMAWTQVGGETLNIEVSVMDGSGKIELTGKLGDVMKESAKAGITYIRTVAKDFNLSPEFYTKKDIHIHIPEGAIPKDGPSAGITMVTAVLSALTGIPVKSNIAMTGEVTLTGKVLAVGGIKEKVLAAYRAGVDTIIMPKDCEPDYIDIPEEVRNNIKFHFVSRMEEVLELALEKRD
ncbi:endopeptidase La [Proteocatella sphenisci]|uniref:endopeptidase La n=1 Tax=Proteocatella sphenisci TaxID=181070 RepID=UPI00048DBFCE|nr:endopeptidase La [Proteocatella sphenisci]